MKQNNNYCGYRKLKIALGLIIGSLSIFIVLATTITALHVSKQHLVTTTANYEINGKSKYDKASHSSLIGKYLTYSQPD